MQAAACPARGTAARLAAAATVTAVTAAPVGPLLTIRPSCPALPACCSESNVVDKLLNKRYAALYPTVFMTYRRDTGALPSVTLPVAEGAAT